MGKANSARKEKPITGRAPEERTQVASPTVPGAVESLMRVTDTLLAMSRRKQLDERHYQAGARYRACYDIIHGQLGGSMDFERARGACLPGQPPAQSYLEACEIVSLVKRILYPKDYAVVHRVCAIGQSLEECAFLFGAGRPAREEAGRRLKAGLGELADRWCPRTPRRIRSEFSERAVVTDVLIVEAGRVHHADS